MNADRAYAALLPFADRLADTPKERQALRETINNYLRFYVREPDVPAEVVLGLAYADRCVHHWLVNKTNETLPSNWMERAFDVAIIEASDAMASLHGSWWHFVAGFVLYYQGRIPSRPRFAIEYHIELQRYRNILYAPWTGY